MSHQTKDYCCAGEKTCYCSSVKIGQKVPDFSLDGYFKGAKKKFSLKDYQGQWVILFFYPLDFTFVCPTEILELSKRQEEFIKLKAQVLGISVDSVYAHEAWCKGGLGNLNFPLLSDLNKKVSADFGVLLEDAGISLRGVFTINPEGVLKAMTIHDNAIGRSTDEILRVLSALQTGELCPIGWKKEQKTLGKA